MADIGNNGTYIRTLICIFETKPLPSEDAVIRCEGKYTPLRKQIDTWASICCPLYAGHWQVVQWASRAASRNVLPIVAQATNFFGSGAGFKSTRRGPSMPILLAHSASKCMLSMQIMLVICIIIDDVLVRLLILLSTGIVHMQHF